MHHEKKDKRNSSHTASQRSYIGLKKQNNVQYSHSNSLIVFNVQNRNDMFRYFRLPKNGEKGFNLDLTNGSRIVVNQNAV